MWLCVCNISIYIYSVVSSAIEEADARFESAKRAEIARSKEAREKRQEARNIRLRARADEDAAVPPRAGTTISNFRY